MARNNNQVRRNDQRRQVQTIVETASNRSASIRTREDNRGKLRTETFRRDDDALNVAVSTNPKTDSTTLFIDTPEGESYRFDGRTARTLYRALQKHYKFTRKSW